VVSGWALGAEPWAGLGGRQGWVCRHMLAECAIAAIRNDDCCDFGIFHTVAIPSPPIAGQPDPRAVCNVADTQAALHVDLSADVREFAADVAKL
jgi:hypothetical protein